MRSVSLFEVNYFLKAFFNTLLLVYDTFRGQKKFTFNLPGECALLCDHLSLSALFRVPEWETLTPMRYRGSRPLMRGSTLVWSAMVSYDLCRLSGANTVSPAISFCKM